MKDRVAIIRETEYDDMGRKLEEGIEAIGGLPDLHGRHIVIKPNLCCEKSSESGATTHVDFVHQIIRILNEKTQGNCRISVVESDAEGVNADRAFNSLDYPFLQKKFPNVRLVNLSKDAKVRVSVSEGRAFDVLEVPRVLLDMEYMISVAKLKTHVDQRLSCILKNQFGLIPKKHKAVFHPILSEVIVDMNNLFMPDLCIVDGIIGMEGFGPTDGRPKRANLILVGSNPVATDMVAAKLIGFEPKQVPHLKLAMKSTNYNEGNFILTGEDIQKVGTSFQFIPLRYYLMARFGLRLQKWSIYTSNFGEFLQKVRSALSLVGFDTMNRKVAFKDAIGIAKKMVFKLSH